MPYQHPALYLGPSPINGQGLFSSVAIAAGATIVTWSGFIATAAEVEQNFAEPRYRNCSQIGPDQFLVPATAGVADHVNHSCRPNCGIRGTHTLVAMRNIPAAAEITYDYAMTDGCDYDVFTCRCQAATCRHQITGSDWKDPKLQTAYHGWFSDYIAQLISRVPP
ncbi:MAG: SET domain-containing protein-lysine N-methyltransferase [Verrucomicrobiota bacterium]